LRTRIAHRLTRFLPMPLLSSLKRLARSRPKPNR
jgi:hypothetical protein